MAAMTMVKKAAVMVACSAVLMMAMVSPASACWDGFAASSPDGRVHVTGSEIGWEPSMVRDVARWMARIERLLPKGVSARIHFGQIILELPEVEKKEGLMQETYEIQELPEAFEKIAVLVGASKDQIALARNIQIHPLTIQLAASRDKAALQKLADKLNQDERLIEAPLHGFIEFGGFPALNDFAHVVLGVDADGVPVHRLYVGSFLRRVDARKVRTRLWTMGFKSFVRVL